MLQNNPPPLFLLLLLFLPACSLRAPRPPRARCRGCPRPFPQRDPGEGSAAGALLPRAGLGLAPGAPHPCTDTSEPPGHIGLPRRCFRSACDFGAKSDVSQPRQAGGGMPGSLQRRNPSGYFGRLLVSPPAVPLAACRSRWAAARGCRGRQDGAGLSGAGGVQGAAEAPCLLPFPPVTPVLSQKSPKPARPRARGERRVARMAKVLAPGGFLVIKPGKSSRALL